MTPKESPFDRIETRLVHAGSLEPRPAGAVVNPVFQSANYLIQGETEYEDLRYIRLSNTPSHDVLQARVAAIESGEDALLTASGMAAISGVLLAHAGNGGHVLVQRALYGGTQGFLDKHAPALGLSYGAVDITADGGGPLAWEKSLRPETKLILVESISNPLMEVGDLRAIVEFAQAHGLASVIDNTFASPVNFRPLEIGFDLVVHSATKYLNGHSDIVAGVVIGSRKLLRPVRHLAVHLGGSLDPHACFLLERGLKTLAVRVEYQNRSAGRLAEMLDRHPAVRRVNYPGLPGDPGFGFANDLFSGFGGMLSFQVDGLAAAKRMIERLKIPLHAASLGGVESLIVRPAESSHLGMPVEQRQRIGISNDLVRVSVGIENPDDLISDFTQALAE